LSDNMNTLGRGRIDTNACVCLYKTGSCGVGHDSLHEYIQTMVVHCNEDRHVLWTRLVGSNHVKNNQMTRLPSDSDVIQDRLTKK
jgi:hypothetical protein